MTLNFRIFECKTRRWNRTWNENEAKLIPDFKDSRDDTESHILESIFEGMKNKNKNKTDHASKCECQPVAFVNHASRFGFSCWNFDKRIASCVFHFVFLMTSPERPESRVFLHERYDRLTPYVARHRHFAVPYSSSRCLLRLPGPAALLCPHDRAGAARLWSFVRPSALPRSDAQFRVRPHEDFLCSQSLLMCFLSSKRAT